MAKKKGAGKDTDTAAAKAKAADKAASPAVDTAARAVVRAAKADAPPTAEEKAAAEAEKERREKRVVEANEKAMRDGQVAPTIAGKTGVSQTKDGVVIFNTGQFAFIPLQKVPTWFLHHLMADAVDNLKWRSLTREQQAEVKKELQSRESATQVNQDVFPPGQGAGAVSDMETVQERRAKEASPIPVGTAAATPTFGEAEGKGHGTGTVAGPGSGGPDAGGVSRKDTDAAMDKAAETGAVPGAAAAEESARARGVEAGSKTEGVTGVETGTGETQTPTDTGKGEGKSKRKKTAKVPA